MAMTDILDMVITDESPSQISDEIKNLLFTKAAERLDTFRPEVSADMFGDQEADNDEEETEE